MVMLSEHKLYINMDKVRSPTGLDCLNQSETQIIACGFFTYSFRALTVQIWRSGCHHLGLNAD